MTALIMAATGIYGVMSHRVEQRRREFGLRMALSARRGGVASMVLGETAATSGAGIAAGLFLALLLSRLMGSILYGISPTDGLLTRLWPQDSLCCRWPRPGSPRCGLCALIRPSLCALSESA